MRDPPQHPEASHATRKKSFSPSLYTHLFDAGQPALLRRAGGHAEAAVPLGQVGALEGDAVVRALVLALARLPDLAQLLLLGLLCGPKSTFS